MLYFALLGSRWKNETEDVKMDELGNKEEGFALPNFQGETQNYSNGDVILVAMLEPHCSLALPWAE